MKLVGTHTSPFVRKARVVLAEKKFEYEFVLDSPWEEESGVPDLNPLGKVPVLILDDDSTLFDSSVICEYLDNSTPNNRLLSQNNRERIQIKRWEALADGICEAAANIVMEKRRPAGRRSAQFVERQMDKVKRGTQYMADALGEDAWCHGAAFTLADVAVGTALGYLVFRLPDFDWRQTYPSLARHYEKLMQRPSFAETVPHGA